jgi:hypothetical protein
VYCAPSIAARQSVVRLLASAASCSDARADAGYRVDWSLADLTTRMAIQSAFNVACKGGRADLAAWATPRSVTRGSTTAPMRV